MEQSKVESFFAINAKFLPDNRKPEIVEKLQNLDDSRSIYVSSVSFKDPMTWLLIYLFAPFVCLIDRIILGDYALGILKFVTMGGLGIWVFIDIFTIMGRIKTYNYKKLSVHLS